MDCPFFEVCLWWFCCVSWTVRSRVMDRLPGVRGPSAQAREPSAWHYAGLLSPLLLELCFRFGIVWGLFLWLVGLL
jgi:hypothetical protein